jgi:peptide subunit release factor 1 (eRF1)
MAREHVTMDDHLLAVVLDRAHARFFNVTASDAVELPGLPSPATRGGKYHSDREDAPGWGERDYHGRLREEQRRHFDAVIDRCAVLQRAHPEAGMLIAGPGHVAIELRRALPDPLAQRVVGTARLNPTEVTPAVVRRTAATMARQRSRETARRLIAALREGLGTGRAENGTPAVLRSLAERRVRTLLLPKDGWLTGFRCRTSGRLVVTPGDCLGEGDPLPVPDLVAAATAQAREQGAGIVVIHDEAGAKEIDGMAALLRFPARE